MQGKVRVTRQLEYAIIKLHQEGLGYVKIEQVLGLKREQVRYVCKKYEKNGHDCCLRARFYREEGIEELRKKLLASEEYIIPEWIKKLIK